MPLMDKKTDKQNLYNLFIIKEFILITIYRNLILMLTDHYIIYSNYCVLINKPYFPQFHCLKT